MKKPYDSAGHFVEASFAAICAVCLATFLAIALHAASEQRSTFCNAACVEARG